jgi:glucokinase
MAKKKLAVGIDIGGTNTVFGFVDRDGNIVAEDRMATCGYENAEGYVADLYKRIMAAGKKIRQGYDLQGFGIGAPMGNIYKGTIEHSAALPWKGIIPLADIFHTHTELPVIVTNDANAAAAGEMIYGGAKKMKNFVVITLGTGLGSGFVVDGKLLYGHGGFAGELGHTPIRMEPSERECGCGKKGCLETYVSASGLKRTFIKILADSRQPNEFRKYSFDEIDAEMIFKAAIKGNKLAIKAFEHTGKILGYKLADVVSLTEPEAIFLYGGLAMAKDLIFKPTKKYMEEYMLGIYRNKVKLLPSKLNAGNAAVLGASSLVWSNDGFL